MKHDLLAKFISRSRDFTSLTRGKEVMKHSARAFQEILGIDSGFFVYQKRLELIQAKRTRVYEPWGVFHGLTEKLQFYLEGHERELLNFFTKAHDKWICMDKLPCEFPFPLQSEGANQIGIFALRSRGKVTGSIVLMRKTLSYQQDESLFTACATQIAMMLDMMVVWRIAQTNEKKYRSLVENNPDAIFELDLDGNVVAVNEAMEKLTGYSKKELFAFKRGSLIAKEDLEKAMQYENDVLKGVPQTYEVTLVHKEGHHKFVSMNRVPIQVDGITIGIFGIAKDITEKKLAEEFIRKSEKLAVVGQLAAGVAHEIRNPLTSLKGFVQLMSESGRNEAFCKIMEDELDRINEIVSEFLVIAKPQDRSFELEDIEVLVQDVAGLVRVQGIMNGVQISVHNDSEIPLVFAARDQLKQVFLNILKNALDSMPEGGVIHVFIKHKGSDRVLIRFEDTGCGIPKERIKRLGEPFYTTKEKGTGLGLMVSYKILEAHQGSIEIQSEVGKGTIVDVILPSNTIRSSKR